MMSDNGGRQTTFLQRQRAYVDSNDANTNDNTGEKRISLSSGVKNVQAVELTDYSIPRDLTPPFYPPQTTNGISYDGAHILDIELGDLSDPEFSLVMSLEVPTLSHAFTTRDVGNVSAGIDVYRELGFESYLDGLQTLDLTLTKQIVNNLNSLGVTQYTNNDDFRLQFSIRQGSSLSKAVTTLIGLPYITLAEDYRNHPFTLLFASGPNAAGNSIHEVLGFKEKVDVSAVEIFNNSYYLMCNRRPKLNKFRYVNVEVSGLPGGVGQPLGRVFTTPDRDFAKQNVRTPSAPRLMPRALENLDTLTFRMSLSDGRLPNPRSTRAWCATFDILFLDEEIRLPSWMKQVFLF
jgi:hypothetical protein